MNVRFALVTGLCTALAVSTIACSSSKKDYASDAARATAQFWQQEAAAGTLPEGTVVREHGTTAGGVIKLDIPSDATKGTKARYCVQYEYIRAASPFDSHVRVYVSTLIDREWVVEAVKPEGTCEGVS